MLDRTYVDTTAEDLRLGRKLRRKAQARRLIVGLIVLGVLAAVVYFGLSKLDVPESPAAAEPVAVPDGTVAATIDYVHDGDTLFIMLKGEKEKVRLIGMDTPEVGDDAECYGDEAREHLRALLPEGTKILVKSDIEKRDQYDRRLFYVFLADGTFVNQELLESGAGELMEFEPNMAYSEELHAAESRAMDAGVGMWGAC